MLHKHDSTGSLCFAWLEFFSAADWWPSDHCVTSFCWRSVSENHSQVWPINGLTAIALAVSCGWGDLVQLWDLRWTPKRRKKIVTENHKQSLEDPELKGRKPMLWRPPSHPVRTSWVVVTTYCRQTHTPFFSRKIESVNRGIQKHIEKVRIKLEKRLDAKKVEGNVAALSFYY